MDTIKVIQHIRDKFNKTESPATIPLFKGDTFTARLINEGIEVDNLGTQPFLPWSAFQETVCVLIRNGGRAMRGDAMNSRLGDPDLSLDSIEGHVAHVVYGKKIGESVFRRITPIACILVWAGICKHEPHELVLL
jgi:hypothetical protein